MIYNNFTELIGNTPLMRLDALAKETGAKANILAKLEYFNPAGSVKDRVACKMITEMEKAGTLKPGATIIEPTSGNTGIGLAAAGAAKGYKVILTMPETMSMERRQLVAAFGAEVVLTDGAKGMSGAIEKANELKKSIYAIRISIGSLKTRQTRRRITRPPARRFGAIRTERSTPLLPGSARAAPSAAWVNI